MAALRLGGVLSCSSAARVHGLSLLGGPATVPHVTVPRGWSKAWAPGVVVHRRDVDPEEISRGVTTVERTVLDAARELPFAEAVAVADGALHRGACNETLRGRARTARGRGAPQLRRVIESADGRAESPIETVLRLLASGLGRVRLQVRIRGVGRVDMVVDGWLVLEADGFDYHGDRIAFREDRRRDRALTVRGFTVLRFTYEDLLFDQDGVLSVIRSTLRLGPRHGFTPGPT